MRHALLWGGLVWLCVWLLLACSPGGSAASTDTDRLQGFWKNESGLYYLDLSTPGMAAFVLPNGAATVNPLASIHIDRQALVLSDGRERFSLKLGRLPPASGSRRCLEIDSARLCETERQ